MTHWSTALPRDACEEALTWASTQASPNAAWKKCKRGDWMLWLLGRLAGPPGSDKRKRLVLCACDCAELAVPFLQERDKNVVRVCLETTRDWASGGATTLNDVRRAANAAYYAAAYAADAAYAASAAAYTADAAYAADAAHAAASAANAVAYCATYATAACAETLKQHADIVRRHYPEAPQLESGGE